MSQPPASGPPPTHPNYSAQSDPNAQGQQQQQQSYGYNAPPGAPPGGYYPPSGPPPVAGQAPQGYPPPPLGNYPPPAGPPGSAPQGYPQYSQPQQPYGQGPPPGQYAAPSGPPPPVPGNRPISSQYGSSSPAPPPAGYGQQSPYQYGQPQVQYNPQYIQPPYAPQAPYQQYQAPPGAPPPGQYSPYPPTGPPPAVQSNSSYPPTGPPPAVQSNYPPTGPPPAVQSDYPPTGGFAPVPVPGGPPTVTVVPLRNLSMPSASPAVPGQIPGQFTYLGAVIPNPNASAVPVLPTYLPTGDVKRIIDATKGFGTNEGVLTEVLTRLNPEEMSALNHAFKATKGKSLSSVIASETKTKGYFCKGLQALISGPLEYDVDLLFKAMDGIGTDKTVLNDVLLSRTNEDMNLLKEAYHRKYNRTLESHIKSELSGNTERFFVIVLSAVREPEWKPYTAEEAKVDARKLYLAGEGRKGTDELAFFNIMALRSNVQLTAIAAAYQAEYNKTLKKVIDKEFSGHLKDALGFIADGTGHLGLGDYYRAAERLEAAMAGAGTKDEQLVRRVVRVSWDKHRLEQVKLAYKKHIQRGYLHERIRGETSGDYMKLMLKLVGKDDLLM